MLLGRLVTCFWRAGSGYGFLFACLGLFPCLGLFRLVGGSVYILVVAVCALRLVNVMKDFGEALFAVVSCPCSSLQFVCGLSIHQGFSGGGFQSECGCSLASRAWRCMHVCR